MGLSKLEALELEDSSDVECFKTYSLIRIIGSLGDSIEVASHDCRQAQDDKALSQSVSRGHSLPRWE